MFPRKLQLLILSSLLLSGCAAAPAQQATVFRDLHDYGLEGNLPDKLEGQVILLDFWASWCGPCRLSFPAMEQLKHQYADQGFIIIAVNVDDHSEEMQQFLSRQKVSFVIVRDAGKSLVAAANVSTMPSSFLLDRTGKVRFTHNGFRGDETVKQYRDEIDLLLKEPNPHAD